MAGAERRGALGAVLAAVALAGCGGGGDFPAACDERPEVRPRAADQARADFASLRLSDLGEGWRSVRPDQPLDVLRPPLGGTVETARTSSPIFTRGGVVVRSSTTLFQGSPGPIAQEYRDCLAGRFETERVREQRLDAGAARITLDVDRPTGGGTDTVTIHAVALRRGLLVVQFVHGGELPRDFELRVVRRVLSRLRTAAG